MSDYSGVVLAIFCIAMLGWMIARAGKSLFWWDKK